MGECVWAKPPWQASTKRICNILRATIQEPTYEGAMAALAEIEAEQEAEREGCDGLSKNSQTTP
jgi:hypothetical protein